MAETFDQQLAVSYWLLAFSGWLVAVGEAQKSLAFHPTRPARDDGGGRC